MRSHLSVYLLYRYRSDEWNHVQESIQMDLELKTQDDGEFWMNYKDFRKEYCNMIICNLSPDFDHDGISDKAGESILYFDHDILSSKLGE